MTAYSAIRPRRSARPVAAASRRIVAGESISSYDVLQRPMPVTLTATDGYTYPQIT